MAEIRFIGLDLDGTVLTHSKQVTPLTRLAIEKALSAGIQVVYVTGRPLGGVPAELLSIPGIRYVISSNGAVTRDLKLGRNIRCSFVNRTAAEEITRIPMREGMIYNVFAGGYGYADRRTHEIICEKFADTPYRDYVAWSKRPVDDIGAFFRENTEGIENIWILADSTQERDRMYGEVSEISSLYDIRMVCTTSTDFEIGGPAADKGLAMTELADMLQISKEEIMAIGDSGNDLGFMEAAGLPVAMANAEKKIRDLSCWVTDDNEHDGVAAAIQKFCFADQ